MNSNRIEEIQKETAYPDSMSVKNGLMQVWHECQIEINDLKRQLEINHARAENIIEAREKQISRLQTIVDKENL